MKRFLFESIKLNAFPFHLLCLLSGVREETGLETVESKNSFYQSRCCSSIIIGMWTRLKSL